MNRRQLFTRLSAIALAPLVKWLPKDEPKIPWRTQPIRFGPYPSPEEIIEWDRRERQRMFDEVERRFWSVPQEEA